jgi:hypothetical protein
MSCLRCSADDVSDTEKLLAVMHSKNVNFTQEAIKIIIHLMALGTQRA